MSKKDKLSNFLPINRRFFQHPFWKEERTFSKAEAWLWLIAEARFDAAAANELVGGKMIRWNRGELPASLRYLAEAWNWEKNQVDRFLKLLEKEAMIIRRLDQGQTIIGLINYGNHNGQNSVGQQMGHLNASLPRVSEDEWDTKRDSKWDTDGTATGQRQDKTNIVNIDKKVKRDSRASSTHPHSNETIQLFEGFKNWIDRNAPRVNLMKEPFTIDQFLELRDKLKKESVQELLISMHNWQPLTTKNRSAYLTLIKWKKLEDNRNTSSNQTEDPKKMVIGQMRNYWKKKGLI